MSIVHSSLRSASDGDRRYDHDRRPTRRGDLGGRPAQRQGHRQRRVERRVPRPAGELGRPNRVARGQDQSGGAHRRGPCVVLRDGPVRRPRPRRDAAGAAECDRRGHLRQARGWLARRVECADRGRAGSRGSTPPVSARPPRVPATAARCRSRSRATSPCRSRQRSRRRRQPGAARVRIRAGLSTVIWRMAASGTPASRSRGRKRSDR